MSAERHKTNVVIAMRRECICIIWHLTGLTLVSLLLSSASFYTNAEQTGHEYLKGCSHLQCENGSQCIKRRFWCKNPPCPGMLYCSKSKQESLKGPFTCDTVHCSSGHMCVIRVRGCRWDEECQQQVARCISEKEYHEGAASCAGFECPSGKRCILRESHCISPPCRLISSCAETKDVQIWFDKCRALDCLSEYECFLRRQDNDCLDTSCVHTPDCTLTAEDELISKHCRGWICPRMQKCVVRIVGSCKGFNCTIERSCRPFNVFSNSSTKHDNNKTEGWLIERTLVQTETGLVSQEAERREMNTPTRYPITRKKTISTEFTTSTTSIMNQIDYTTSHGKHGTEISVIHQQTTKSSSMIESPNASSTRPHSILSYSRSWSNTDKLSTTSIIDDELKIPEKGLTTSRSSDLSENSSFSATSFPERKFGSTTARDTKLELLKKINNVMLSLPVVLEGINLVGQGYPISIENQLHRTTPLKAEDEDESEWSYHASWEPYRILLPPYEPVILVKDMRRGQLPPFLTYSLGHPYNEAALLSLQEIPSRDITGISRMDRSPMNVVKGISNETNIFTTEMGNHKTNYFDDSFGDYANLGATEKTDIVSSNIQNGESDNYYDEYKWRPWYEVYLDKREPQSIYKKELISNIDEFATDNPRRNETYVPTEIKQLTRDQIVRENRDQVFDIKHIAYRHNKNLTTLDPIRAHVLTGRNDYVSEDDKERYRLVNYPYDTTLHDVNKVNEHRGSSPKQILDISQRQQSTTFSLDELDEQRNGQPTASFLHETSLYRTYNDNSQKNDDHEYDEYYNHENYNISGIETTGS